VRDFAAARQIALGAKSVGSPYLDELFNRLAVVHFFVQDLSRQRGEFRIAGEAEGDELIHCEIADAGLQIGREKPLVPEMLFETNYAILNLQCHEACDSQCDDESGGNEDLEDRIGGKIVMFHAEDRPNEIRQQNRRREKVKWREEPRVVRQILLLWHWNSSKKMDD
jgi:hypothetical protein